MAINFPNSPATNDTFVGPTGIEYIYDGVKWRSFKPTEPVVGTFNANSAISLTAGGTNQNITLTPSGTGIVTVPSSVGIGTTTPASKLQVTTTDGAAPVNTSGSNALRLRSTATAAVGVGPSILFEGQTGNTSANYGFAAIQGFKGLATAGNYSGALAFYTQNSGGATGLTERMRIDAFGNVGIGGTSSAERLEVYGSALAISTSSGTVSVIAQTGTTTDYSTLSLRQSTTESRIQAVSTGTAAINPLTFIVGASERIRIAANGNIGIATTTPSVPLNVAVFGVSNVPLATNAVVRIEQGSTGSSETTLQIVARDQSGGGAAIHFGVGTLAASTRIASFGGTTGLIIQENSGGPIILNAGGERMRILGSGQALIGGNATSLTAIPGSLGNSSTYARVGMTVVNDTTTLAYFQTYNSNATTDLKTWRHGGQTDGSYVFQTVNDAYSASAVKLTLTTAGVLSDGKGDVRSAPIQTKSAAYVVVASDAGQTIYISTGGVTINASILSAGDMVTIVNNSASNQTITAGASVTFRLAGFATTGNRTLAQYGMATFLCVVGGATPTFHCSGAGLT